MENYTKPSILVNEEMAEDVYMSSGDTVEPGTETTASGPKCDSIYMQGNFKPMGAFTPGATMYQARGCEGCVSNWGSKCALGVPGAADEPGNHMPWWEKQGYKDTDSAQPGDFS